MMGSSQLARALALGPLFVVLALVCAPDAQALDPSLDVSQYAHGSWKVRDGFTKGMITSLAQTPDGYLWLGSESGLLRFDGVRVVPWQPPTGQSLPGSLITTLLTARDGTLWIGTFTGLSAWKKGKLSEFPELRGHDILSLLETRDGAVWAGTYEDQNHGSLCDIRAGLVHCEILTAGIRSLYQDHNGTLWVGLQNGVWRWTPARAKFFPVPDDPAGITCFAEDDEGELLLGSSSGIRQIINGRVEPYSSSNPAYHWQVIQMFRDQGGSLWVGTAERGLLHIHAGRTDAFSSVDGLSGDYVTRFLEDREGSIWVATVDGLDRFRTFAASTISRKEGLSSNAAWSLLASKDGSVWISTNKGLNHWVNGQIFQPGSSRGSQISEGYSNLQPTYALFQQRNGQIWVSSGAGVGYLQDNVIKTAGGVHAGLVHSMAEDLSGSLWAADQQAGLLQMSNGRLLNKIPWAALGRRDYAKVMVADPSRDGIWLGFHQGGVDYFANGKIRASYSASNGLSAGEVTDLRFGTNGELWAATESGLSRLKDGRVAILSSKNGLPCDKVYASIEDEQNSTWLYLACGLARIAKAELEAWTASPRRIIAVDFFDLTDGVRSHASTGGFQPLMTRSADGRIWFAPWDGASVVDPHDLPFNAVPPPVHVEQITADGRIFDPADGLQLPAHMRNLAIDYTALSLVAPEKVHFRYKLEGQDPDWREVVNTRQVQYSNLPPRHYTFRVIACNNSGVWNEAGASLDFSIAPAYYQTNWFRIVCVIAFAGLLWALYQQRLRQMQRQFQQYVGLSPKQLAGIAQFLRAYHLLARVGRHYNMLDVALDAGYCDGASFSNACKKITGHYPSQLRFN